MLKMRREPSEKTFKETLKAGGERERERETTRFSKAATCHFSKMAENPARKGRPGELFRCPSHR